MTNDLIQAGQKSVRPQPGYLLAPLGWAAQRLLDMLGADQNLATEVLKLSRARMHLIALAFAYCDQTTRPLPDAEFLLRASTQRVLDAVLERRPMGLERALKRLPVRVLPAESYGFLINLLDDPSAANILRHARWLTPDSLSAIHEVPAPLRRVAALAFEEVGVELRGFVESLQVLVARGAAATLDELVGKLASLRQPAQLLAEIKKLVFGLPYPDFIPPAAVGGAQRVDDLDQIRKLANQWKNCLWSAHGIDLIGCRAAVYLWPDEASPAICLASRYGRLGWALQDAKGPENAELSTEREKEIEAAFATAGLPHCWSLEMLQMIARTEFEPYWERRQRRDRRRLALEEADYEEMFEDF